MHRLQFCSIPCFLGFSYKKSFRQVSVAFWRKIAVGHFSVQITFFIDRTCLRGRVRHFGIISGNQLLCLIRFALIVVVALVAVVVLLLVFLCDSTGIIKEQWLKTGFFQVALWICTTILSSPTADFIGIGQFFFSCISLLRGSAFCCLEPGQCVKLVCVGFCQRGKS